MFINIYPHDLEEHVGMIALQTQLGAHLYVTHGIRGRWYAINLMGGLLVEELGAAALVAIVNGVVGSGRGVQ